MRATGISAQNGHEVDAANLDSRCLCRAEAKLYVCDGGRLGDLSRRAINANHALK